MTAGDGVVTVCIPAYQAAAFVDRTLRCAREQTYEAQRIVVSIDRSDDGTDEICRAHARADDRVEVHSHAERLGWVGNVNFLLDAVRSEFAFVYFHDDVIEPSYSERLVSALRQRPDAASAHCDVLVYGGGDDRVRLGRAYDGTPVERLLAYFVSPNRGALLRSLVRTASPASTVRMTVAGALYEMALVAAGPVVRVAEPLYRRWEERPGGLTDGFARRPFGEVVEGCRTNAVMARALIDGLRPSAAEQVLLEFGLAVYTTNRLRWLETRSAANVLVRLEEVLEAPADLQLPPAVDDLPHDLRELCTTAVATARARTAARARRLGGAAAAS